MKSKGKSLKLSPNRLRTVIVLVIAFLLFSLYALSILFLDKNKSVSFLDGTIFFSFSRDIKSYTDEIKSMDSIVWLVVNPNGTKVFRSAGGSTIILKLPEGSLIMGNILSFYPNVDSKTEKKKIFLNCVAPISGWIPLFSQSLHINIRALNASDRLETPHPQCKDSTSFQSGVDFKGGDLRLPGNPSTVSTATHCCEQCAATLSCVCWSYQPNGLCWLKEQNSRFTRSKQPIVSGSLTDHQEFSKKLSNSSVSKKKDFHHVIPTVPCCDEGADELFEDINPFLQDLNFSNNRFLLRHVDLLPPSVVLPDSASYRSPCTSGRDRPFTLSIERSSAEWWAQWPLGNGRFGGLVGGTLRQEVIPLSVAGLFFRRQKQEKPKKTAVNGESFRRAREALKQGDMRAADALMASLERDDLGGFQYFFDLVLRFSPSPFPNTRPAASEDRPGKRAVRRKGATGRQLAMQHLLSHFFAQPPDPPTPPQPKRTSPMQKSVPKKTLRRLMEIPERKAKLEAKATETPVRAEVSRGILDLRRGLSHSFFVERDVGKESCGDSGRSKGVSCSSSHSSGGRRLHHRQWFVSEQDDVMVGSFSCSNGVSAGSDIIGCLNFAILPLRQHQKETSPDLSVAVESFTLNGNQQLLWGEGTSKKTEAFSFSMEISANKNTLVPSTYAFGVVICIAGSRDSDFFLSSQAADDVAMVCNHATHAYVILHICSDGETFTSNSCLHKPEDAVERALDLGFETLLRRHQVLFSRRMSRVDLSLSNGGGAGTQETPPPHTCARSPLKSRLESFSSGCSVSPSNRDPTGVAGDSTDLLLVAQSYQFGRYLLLSGATRAVSNLQGLWADGPTAPWSGDYHLNINLQMTYWAVDAAGISETMAPLMGFIDRLQEKGAITAENMYGHRQNAGDRCPAWVAHGFTDGGSTDLLGASQWGLCVTCGAWAALSLWEHLLTRPFAPQGDLVVKMLCWFRGLVRFFQQYLWEETGVVHSGPSTSPENSYIIVYTTDGKKEDQDGSNKRKKKSPTNNHVLCFSPAIDISLLRQVANVFLLLVEWSKPSESEKESYSVWEEDSLMASSFVDLIWRMPNNALPVTTTSALGPLISEYPQPLQFYSVAEAQTAPAADEKEKKVEDDLGVDDPDIKIKVSEKLLKGKRNKNPLPLETFRTCSVSSALLSPLQTPTQEEEGKNEKDNVCHVEESFDLGHRHFSGLHWLFPNSLLPVTGGPAEERTVIPELLEAARNTLTAKSQHGGGHTGWSAVWEACLWARVGRGEDAFTAINKLLTQFLSPNLLSLHPPLIKTPGSPKECSTCFTAPPSVTAKAQNRLKQLKPLVEHIEQLGALKTDLNVSSSIREQVQRELEKSVKTLYGLPGGDMGFDIPLLNRPRGMVLTDESKFQFEANAGFVAVVHEMFLQSHLPGQLLFFPAVPTHWTTPSGHFLGLRVRGDLSVSFTWERGMVQTLELVFHSRHPWLYNVQSHPTHTGFYTAFSEEEESQISLILKVPNPLELVGFQATEIKTCFGSTLRTDNGSETNNVLQRLILSGDTSFPCRVRFCGLDPLSVGPLRNSEKKRCRERFHKSENEFDL